MGRLRRVVKLGFPWVTLDPFLFCVHHRDAYPKGTDTLGPSPDALAGRELGNDFSGQGGWSMYHGTVVPGFPQHPHRGFETVTIARKGFIDHSDSLGATARFGPGDVQWLTAGRGIVHSEMFPLLQQESSNPVELFQIWLNLPRAHKMVEPHFSMLWNEAIPKPEVVDATGRRSTVTVVAGRFGNAQAPASPPKSWATFLESDIAIWTIEMQPEARLDLPEALSGSNRMLFVFEGRARVAGEWVERGYGAEVEATSPCEVEAGRDGASLLVLQGRPIGEPVVQYGPFVMNTQAEIREAVLDFQRTQFGGWPHRHDDAVHGREPARFARHADGHVETRAVGQD
jgi:redox-sensitive bicupin YhaK (pirin superfamily)